MVQLLAFIGAVVVGLTLATGAGWLLSNLTIKDRSAKGGRKTGEKK